jgi:rod shape determining protein RodA
VSRARRLFSRHFDWMLVGTALTLVVFGVLMVYSATQVPSSPARHLLWRQQILWACLGLSVAAIVTAVPYRAFEEYGHFLYGAGIVLLLMVPVIGIEEYGAKRWLDIGGFNFQPSEPAKILTVLMIARYLSNRRIEVRRPFHLLGAVAIMLLPFVLILKQPDLGTSLSLPASFCVMLYWAGMPALLMLLFATPIVSVFTSLSLFAWIPYMLVLGGTLWALKVRRIILIAVIAVNAVVGLGTPQIWNHLKPYQRERIVSFLDPNHDRSGSGYQIIQSRIAIGSGGFIGKGYLGGTQKALSFLPMQHTDFIYSVVGEEFGFVGSFAVLALLGVLIVRGFQIAGRVRNRFASLLAVGISATIFFHVLVNAGMALGLAPVTGLPLPFISYGGTFMVTCLFQVGLLLNVAIRRNEY